MLYLREADIVLTRSKSGILGPLIRQFESYPGDPAWANHAALVTHAGLVQSTNALTRAEITEALWHVMHHSIWESYGPPAGPNRPEIRIYRPLLLSDDERLQAATKAESYIGQAYAWWGLLLQAGDLWLSDKYGKGKELYALRHLDIGDRVICSQLVGRAYAAKYSFGLPAGAIPNPDDIQDYCDQHEQEFTLVYGPGQLS